jgi:hypothetical protein
MEKWRISLKIKSLFVKSSSVEKNCTNVSVILKDKSKERAKGRMESAALWNVMPCSLVKALQTFEGMLVDFYWAA